MRPASRPRSCRFSTRHSKAASSRSGTPTRSYRGQGKRLSSNREFFEVDPTAAINAILDAPGKMDAISPENIRDHKRANAPVGTLLDDLLAEGKRLDFGKDGHFRDESEALKLYERAAKLGSGPAHRRIAFLHSLSPTKTRNTHDKVLRHFRAACELGHLPSWPYLASTYADRDEPQNEREAWKRFAAANTVEDTEESLIAGAIKFLCTLELTYFPCDAKLHGCTVPGAMTFIRRNAPTLEAFTEKLIAPTLTDMEREEGLIRAIYAKTVENHRTVLRWLREL